MKESNVGTNTLRFEDIAYIISDRIDDPSQSKMDKYIGLEHLDSDSLKIRRWGSPGDVSATKFIFRTGDIIFGKRRVYQRKVAVADFDGICSAHAMVLRPNAKSIIPDLLPFFMQSDLFMTRALDISVGSLSPTINWKTLSAEEFVLPHSDKQKQILKPLQAMETHLDNLHALKESSDTLFQSHLRETFPVRNDTLADGWEWVKLGDICQFVYGSNLPSNTRIEGIVPVYGSNGIVGFHNTPFINEPCLIIGRKGTVGVVHVSQIPCWPIDTTYYIPQSSCDPEFYWLYYLLLSLRLSTLSKATAVGGLNRDDAYKIPVALPPMSDQKRIADHLESIRGITDKITDQIEHLKTLKRSLLNESFSSVT